MLLINLGLVLGSILSFFKGGSPPESALDTMTDVGTQACCVKCLFAVFSWVSCDAKETVTGLVLVTLTVTTVVCAAVGAATVCMACDVIG